MLSILSQALKGSASGPSCPLMYVFGFIVDGGDEAVRSNKSYLVHFFFFPEVGQLIYSCPPQHHHHHYHPPVHTFFSIIH